MNQAADKFRNEVDFDVCAFDFDEKSINFWEKKPQLSPHQEAAEPTHKHIKIAGQASRKLCKYFHLLSIKNAERENISFRFTQTTHNIRITVYDRISVDCRLLLK